MTLTITRRGFLKALLASGALLATTELTHNAAEDYCYQLYPEYSKYPRPKYVGAYHYLFDENHWNEFGHKREPTLGHYSPRDPKVIEAWANWYKNYLKPKDGEAVMHVSWWGLDKTNYNIDETLREYVLKHPAMDGVKVAIFCETDSGNGGVLKTSSNGVSEVMDMGDSGNRKALLNYFDYWCKNYFNDPHYYMREKDRPVVSFYLARLWQPPDQVLSLTKEMRKISKNYGYGDPFIVGDVVFWNSITSDVKKLIQCFDGVTSCSLHLSFPLSEIPFLLKRLDHLYSQWTDACIETGVEPDFVVQPGFDDNPKYVLPLRGSMRRTETFYRDFCRIALKHQNRWKDRTGKDFEPRVFTANEYFEGAEIFPSLQDGDKYLVISKEELVDT